MTLRLSSLNVRGMRNQQERRKMFKHFKSMEYDVIMLQETHSTPNDVELWEKQWGGPCFFSHGDNLSRGVAILFSNKNVVVSQSIYSDPNGRIIIIEATLKDISLTLVNIYAPNKDSPMFFKELFQKLDLCEQCDKVIGGDFNVVMDPVADRHNCRESHTSAMKTLNNYVSLLDYNDVWRTLHTETKEYTWRRKKFKGSNEYICARLDYFLVTQSICGRVTKAEHCSGLKSDHLMITLNIRTDTPIRGKGFWKHNAKLLENEDYVSQTRMVINRAKTLHVKCNPQTRWELVKCDIISFTNFYSRRLAYDRKTEYNNLVKKMDFLSKIVNTDYTEAIEKELKSCQDKLSQHLRMQVEKHRLFSKTKWHIYGERSNKFFFSLAKSRYNRKVMQKIIVDDNIITDPKGILTELARFYQKLYTEDPKVRYNIKFTSKNRISSAERNYLDEDITVEELRIALKDFDIEKTPGCDGLTTEFYKEFWPEVEQLYVGALKHGIQNHKLHISARRGILSLIPKRNCDMFRIRSWRPLTILSMDNKIYSKALDNRLKTVLGKIIAPYQTGFMSGRYILTNVLKLMDVMSTADSNKTKAIIMAIDFEKCFDMISFSAIRGALRYFGIGEKFVEYVMLLFTDFELCAQNNGHISDWIKPTRGLHQGCCISPHLFNCTGQVFADLLENNREIDAYTARGVRNLLAQFADDTNMFLEGNEKTVRAVSSTLKYAERNLGLKVNVDKTTMYRIGSLQQTDARFYTKATYSWAEPPVVTLGISVSLDNNEMCKLNLVPIIHQIEDTLNLWSKRKLTLMGRTLIVNTLIESKLVYRLSVLSELDVIISQQIQDLIWSYIWEGKRAKINFNILSAPKDHGGLRLCDIRAKHTALLCQWVLVLRDDGILRRALHNAIPMGIKPAFLEMQLRIQRCTETISRDYHMGMYHQSMDKI